MATLADQIKTFQEAGFSEQEINDWKKEEIQSLAKAGFTTQEIAKDLGYKEINLTPIRNAWKEVLSIGKEEHEEIFKEIEQLEAQNDDTPFLEKRKQDLVGKVFEPKKYWERGWGAGIWDLHQSYVSGEEMPDMYRTDMPDDTGFLERNIMNISRLAKDLPVYAAAAVPFGLATRQGDVTAAGSAFVAGSLRQTYLTALQNDEVNGFNEFFKVWTEEGWKAGATEAAQLYASLRLGGMFKGPLKKTFAQAVGFEATGAAIHGEMPSKEQMQDSLFLFGLFNYGGATISKSKDIIKKNDRNLPEFAEDVVIHKTMAEDVPSSTNQNPRHYGTEKTTTYKPEKFKEGIKFKTAEEQAIFDKTQYSERKPVTTVDGVKSKAVELKDNNVTDFVDRLHPVRKIVEQVQNVKNMKDALNVYEQFRILLGVENRAGSAIERGTFNKNLVVNGKSFKDIIEPLFESKVGVPFLPEKVPFSLKAKDLRNRQTYAEFNNYAIAKRVIEKGKQDIETGITLEIANKVANNKQLIKKYEKTRKELIEYNQRILEYAKDRGLLTQDAFNAMVKANKEYIGFARVMEATAKGETGTAVSPLKMMKGSKRDIIDPIETTYSNTFAIIKKTERNAAISEFINLVEKGKAKGLFPDINKKTLTKSIKLNEKELKDLGIDTSTLSSKTIENLQVFRREFGTIGDDSIGVIRNGKYEVWEVGKDLADALKDFDPRATTNLLTGLAAKPASWLRAGATLAFDFVGANFLRDTVQATIYSKYGFFPVVSSMRGLFDIIAGKTGLSKKSQKLYEDWVKSGGLQSTLQSVDRAIFDKPAFDILNKGQIRNKAENPIEILRIISETFENATRISEFRRAYNASIKKGLTHRQAIERAGFESRDITLDFGKMGTKIKTLNQISAFYNARIQGYAKILDSYRERPTRVITTIAGGIMIPTALLWFLNRDDEDIQNQPEWVKRHYWLVSSGEGENKIIHKIPKPFDVGVVFASLVESWLDHNYSKDETTRKQMDDWFTDYLKQTGKGFIPTPQVILPIYEAWTNKSWFRNQPLVPEYIAKNLPNEMQYTNYTSESAKLIATTLYKIIGTDSKFTNPIVIDNFIRGWTGTLGRYAIQASDKALIESGVIDDPIRPTQPLTSMPVFRAFLAKNPDLQSQWISMFYEEYNKVQNQINKASALEKEGKGLESQEILDKIDDRKFQLITYGDAIKEYGAIIRNIYNNKQYTADEKRELIDQFALIMIQTAKRSLDLMNIKVDNKEQ
ncbi:hypothetical protein Lederberg_8 [Pelagibacter phage Lederberg EXVC029P]|nr:hypothetical protein Lederberg_8 [Pelagibacter phage Lederberg EXVC029P]